MILMGGAIGFLMGVSDIKPALAAFVPLDCPTTKGAVDANCVLVSKNMEPNCACNYNYTCSSGAMVNIKCNPNSDLVCSNREDVPSFDVVVNQKDKVMAMQDWFCHIKNGSDTACSSNQACEAGGVCQDGKCEADIGGGVVSGLFGEEISDIRDTIRMFINIALGFLGVITVIFIIYGGLIWMTAAGAEDKVKKGKDTLMWAAIGAIVISIAWTIASYVLQIGKTVG